jgi:hypothetical protein
VPNGTTSAGYLVPAPQSHSGKGPDKHHGQPHATQTNDPGQPSAQPSQEPSQEPTQPADPGVPTGGGGGGGLPVPSLPPLPSTSIPPVDELLTQAQAIVQCTLDGYIDNLLRDDDPFDQCVYDYTH